MPATALAPFQFDVDKLLSPITPGNPSGNDLRYDPAYDHIKALRREDDASLPQGVWKIDPKRADWSAVETACLDVLESRSKDLQVCAWLLDAWLHLYGFVGVAEGFRAMHALADVYWDDLHPRMRGNDAEFRISPVVWLNSKLPPNLKLLPLTAPESSDLVVCTLAAWERASAADGHARSATHHKGPEVTLSQLEQSAMLTPTPLLSAKKAEVETVLLRVSELDRLLDDKLGKEAPGLMPVRGVCESCLNVFQALLRDRHSGEPERIEAKDYNPVYFSENYLDDQAEPVRIRNRAEAYQMLSDAAEYLARTEPHSPTPYLVRRAISWGSMPLEQVLSELVRNQGELSEIYRLLDVNPAPPAKK